jgi:hypothetical protein
VQSASLKVSPCEVCAGFAAEPLVAAPGEELRAASLTPFEGAEAE